jgi:hypothetical protein
VYGVNIVYLSVSGINAMFVAATGEPPAKCNDLRASLKDH